MYGDGSIRTYLEDAAARKPAPGGGSISALAGALAAAMSEMSANFTAGRKKYADVEEEIRALLEGLAGCREALLKLVDLDVQTYGAVDAAYGMPKATDEETAARRAAIDAALRGAMQAPLDVMRQCGLLAQMADRLVDIGNRNLITDVGVSAILAEAACAAARLNVEVNLKFLRDDQLSADTTAEMDDLTRKVTAARDTVAGKVADHLTG